MAANSVRSDKIWMDGEMVPYDQANVHVLTHSLHYGLAVFEGMRCYKCDDGRSAIFRAQEHIRRLFDSAHIVEMPIPFSPEEVLKACADVVRVNKFDECYLRPIAFYGAGEMGVVGARQPGAGGDRGVAVGRVSGRRRHHQGRAAEDLVVRAVPSQLDDADGEGYRRIMSIRSWRATRRAATVTTRRCCST